MAGFRRAGHIFCMRTEAVTYLTTGSGMPDAVRNSIVGTGFSVTLVNIGLCKMILSQALPPGEGDPILLIIIAVCILVVATTIDLWGTHLVGMPVAPWKHPLLVCQLPAVSNDGGPACHKPRIYVP